MNDDPYELSECSNCGGESIGNRLCPDCELDLDTQLTKSERREAAREKGRYGPVRHLPGDFRPPKLRVKVR